MAPVRVDPDGESGPTRKQARGARWRRSSHGLYVPSTTDPDDAAQRIVEAAALLRSGDGVTGWAALHWWGGHWFTGVRGDRTLRPVSLVTRQYLAPRRGIHVSQERHQPREITDVEGVPVTPAVRSVCYEMRHAPSDRAAVVALDMAAYSDLVSVAEAGAYAGSLGGWRGIARCRRALALADENSWSPQEVLMRLVWELDGGRPRPLVNVAVFDGTGRHVATPDLLDPVAGVVGEYDGSLHLARSQRTRDVRREGELRALGLEYVTMLASDHTDGYRSFLQRLETAYARARHAAESARDWTVTPPQWWTDTTTVAARRRLGPRQRARLLGYRRPA